MSIEIDYDGEWPNLCSGRLIVTINGKQWEFPNYCLSSGGSVSFDKHYNETINYGPWTSLKSINKL